MMKLYFKPLACSLAVHIALREIDVPFELVRVTSEGAAHRAEGEDYLQIHPLASVPTLIVQNGGSMTETAIILEYLASLVSHPSLTPVVSDPDYWTFRQLMNLIATDVHKNFGPLIYPNTTEEVRDAWIGRLSKRLKYLSTTLIDQPYLLSRGYSVADIYLFVMLIWCDRLSISIEQWPNLPRYFDVLAERPAVREALTVERSYA